MHSGQQEYRVHSGQQEYWSALRTRVQECTRDNKSTGVHSGQEYRSALRTRVQECTRDNKSTGVHSGQQEYWSALRTTRVLECTQDDQSTGVHSGRPEYTQDKWRTNLCEEFELRGKQASGISHKQQGGNHHWLAPSWKTTNLCTKTLYSATCPNIKYMLYLVYTWTQ